MQACHTPNVIPSLYRNAPPTPQIDFGIAARLEVTRPNSIVLMGIESDVDAAAERVRRTSDEFRETQEHHSVENHQARMPYHYIPYPRFLKSAVRNGALGFERRSKP